MRYARNGAAVTVLVVGLAIQWRWIGAIFSDWWFVFGLPWLVWLIFPFVAVAAAIADGRATLSADALGLGLAVAGTLLVPIWVERSIEDDPSSTAPLIHLWDPLPTTLAVGAVFGFDYLLRRRFANRS